MDFKSTYTLKSVSLPGVVVTLKRMGPKRRAEVELSVSAARAKQRELSMRHEAARQKLIAAIDASPKDEEGKPLEAELSVECLALGVDLQGIADEASALVRAQIHPAFILETVKSFGGTEALTYDGKAASAALVCELGPDDLFDELVAAINANAYLPAKEAENLSSRIFSAVPEDNTQPNSIVNDASPDANSLPAAV